MSKRAAALLVRVVLVGSAYVFGAVFPFVGFVMGLLLLAATVWGKWYIATHPVP